MARGCWLKISILFYGRFRKSSLFRLKIVFVLAYRELCVAVHLEPVGADEVLLVKHGVIRAEEVEILELKKKKIVSKILIQNYVRSIKINLL